MVRLHFSPLLIKTQSRNPLSFIVSTVVDYGFSLFDKNNFYLIHSHENLEQRKKSQEAFYGKDDWYVFLFTADEFDGTLIDSPEGNLAWIKNDELTELNLWDGDKVFIPWLFQNKFFSAKFNYEDGKYVSHEVLFY